MKSLNIPSILRRKIIGFIALIIVVAPLFAASAKGKSPVEGVLNINTASTQELMLLPGIGKSKADAIVAFRQNHPFTAASEIVEVKGIGPKMYEKIKDHLSVDGATTLKAVSVAAPAPVVSQQ